MSKQAGPKKISKEQYVPEVINIKLQDLLVLYVNLSNAKKHPEVGYQDSDNQFEFTWRLLNERIVAVKQKELEALLWCCVHMDEIESGSQFWHPNNKDVNSFIKGMLHHKQMRFYFDKIYNFFRSRKPKQGIPKEALVTIGDEDV